MPNITKLIKNKNKDFILGSLTVVQRHYIIKIKRMGFRTRTDLGWNLLIPLTKDVFFVSFFICQMEVMRITSKIVIRIR